MNHPPRARHDLLSTALEEEVVLYDPDRQRAHSLNRVAVAVWRQCDGNNSVAEILRLAGIELGLPVDERVVWRALAQLQSLHLLVEGNATGAVSRRAVLRKAGRLGLVAIATPVIASALIPVAAAAASRPHGLRRCGQTGPHGRDDEDEGDETEEEEGCSAANPSCVCSRTTSGVRVCINPSTALKKKTCKKDSDCRPGYLCIPRGAALPRCIARCAVPTCAC